MNVSKRSFLKLFAAAPVALADQTKMLGMAAHPAVSGARGGEVAAPGRNMVTFTDYTEWFKKFGDAQARKQAEYFHGFDADLIDMRWPIATKVRVQRERNYDRIVEERKASLLGKLAREGSFSWWPD